MVDGDDVLPGLLVTQSQLIGTRFVSCVTCHVSLSLVHKILSTFEVRGAPPISNITTSTMMEEALMPPPRKVYVQGTSDYQLAQERGFLHVSVSPTPSDNEEASPSVTPPTSPRFSDIVGHGAVKLRMQELLMADLLEARGIPVAHSLLLHGPPGCGKTQLAQALATEAQAAFVPLAPSDIFSKFVGESEASVRQWLAQAYELAQQVPSRCAVVFLDELDALGPSRDASQDPCLRRVLAEWLTQLSQLAHQSS